MAIKIDGSKCGTFTGHKPHTTENPLVPRQLKHAHLHPLRALGATNSSGESIEKAPSVKWGEYESDLPKGTIRYGVCLTRSRLVVIDLDRHQDDADGVTAFERLCKEAGESVPDTFTVRSPNNGYHLYFTTEGNPLEGLKKAASLWPGVDVFPENQQVCGPGTTATKKDGSGKGTYEVAKDVDIAPLPIWLSSRIRAKMDELKDSKKVSKRKMKPQNAADFSELPRRAQEKLELLGRRFNDAEVGTRNDACFTAGRQAGDAGIPTDIAVAYLGEKALEAFDSTSGYNHEKALATITDGLALGEKERVPKTYYDDIPMAHRFVETLRGERCYILDRKKWMSWVGDKPYGPERVTNRWVLPDDQMDLDREIQKFSEREQAEAEESGSEFRLELCSRSYLLSDNKQQSVKRRVLVMCSKPISAFDSDPLLYGMKNGVYDARTDQLLPHHPEFLMTQQMGGSYTDSDEHEVVKLLLEMFPNQEKKDSVMFWLGQSIAPAQPASRSFINLWGDTSNGKSKLVALYRAAGGDYVDNKDADTLAPAGNANAFGMDEFEGARGCLIVEPNGEYVVAGSLKKLTGGDGITARIKMVQEIKKFESTATIIFVTNHKLKTNYSDNAVDKRIQPVEAPYEFTDDSALVSKFPLLYKLADPRADTAPQNQEAVDVFASIMVRHASAWWKAGIDRAMIENRYNEAFREDKEEYLKESNNLKRLKDEYYGVDPDGRLSMTYADLRDSLAHFWNEEYSTVNSNKKKLADNFLKLFRSENVEKLPSKRFDSTMERSPFYHRDKSGDLTVLDFEKGTILKGLCFKADLEHRLDQTPEAQLQAAQRELAEIASRAAALQAMIDDAMQTTPLLDQEEDELFDPDEAFDEVLAGVAAGMDGDF